MSDTIIIEKEDKVREEDNPRIARLTEITKEVNKIYNQCKENEKRIVILELFEMTKRFRKILWDELEDKNKRNILRSIR